MDSERSRVLTIGVSKIVWCMGTRRGGGLDLTDCCGLWHQGLSVDVFAPTPEALMR